MDKVSSAVAGAAVVLALALGAGACGSKSPSAVRTSGTPSASSSATTAPTSDSSGTTGPAKPLATEFNPPGDIPDDAVFVDHAVPGSTVHLTVPEGWARSVQGRAITWTDKYNSVSIEVRPAAAAPTVATARSIDVPALRSSVPRFAGGQITAVDRKHGPAVHITYLLDSAPSPVTGKVVRDVAERFEFWHAGREAILTLTGPEHADNVDPWQIVSDSLRWQ